MLYTFILLLSFLLTTYYLYGNNKHMYGQWTTPWFWFSLSSVLPVLVLSSSLSLHLTYCSPPLSLHLTYLFRGNLLFLCVYPLTLLALCHFLSVSLTRYLHPHLFYSLTVLVLSPSLHLSLLLLLLLSPVLVLLC